MRIQLPSVSTVPLQETDLELTVGANKPLTVRQKSNPRIALGDLVKKAKFLAARHVPQLQRPCIVRGNQ